MKELTINGAVVQAYPLTAAQRIHFYTVSACKRWELLNIGTGFYLEYSDVDFDVLKECIYDGYEKFECMRLRFSVQEDGTLMQYLIPAEDRDIEVVDFSDWNEDDAHKRMEDWTRIPFKIDNGPMNEIKMIKLPGGYTGLYMKVQHLTLDSQGITSFYSYVLQLYCSKMFEDTPAPKPPMSYLKQLELDLKYEDNSEKQQKDRDYWIGQLDAPEPMYTPFSSRNRLLELREQTGKKRLRAAYPTGNIEAAIKVYDLEADSTDRLLDFCKENNVPVASLLLLGLRTVFSHFSDNRTDISLKNAVARRGTLLEQKSGGTRIHFWPLRTDIKPKTTFMDALRIVQAKENELLRHANFDPILYMGMVGEHYKAPQGAGYDCTTLTYQPVALASLQHINLPEINYKSRWYTNGVAMQHVYVTVMHRPTDHGMSVHFEYQKNEVSEDELEKLYYYLCRAIFKGIEDPSITIGEILDWM